MQSFQLTVDEHVHNVMLEMTIGKARRLKAQHGVDLLDGDPSELMTRMLMSPTLRLDMVWLMATEDTQNGFRSQEQFEDALNAEALDKAQEAVMAELIFFIQSLDEARGKAIAAALPEIRGAMNQQMETAVELAAQVLNSPEIKREMATMMENAKSSAIKQLRNSSIELQAR